MCRLCPIRNGIQRCPPVKENLRWKGPNSIYNFHHHNEGAADLHYVIGTSFAFCGLSAKRGYYCFQAAPPPPQHLQHPCGNTVRKEPTAVYYIVQNYDVYGISGKSWQQNVRKITLQAGRRQPMRTETNKAENFRDRQGIKYFFKLMHTI
jgi:hypothetical protein